MLQVKKENCKQENVFWKFFDSHGHSFFMRSSGKRLGEFFIPPSGLTYCGLVTPYGNRILGQHWLRYWLVAWQHQAITWTNIDWSSVKSRAAETCGLHGLVRLEPKLMGAIKSGRNWLNSKMCKFRELLSAKIGITQCRIELCFCWVITVINKINEYINVTPLAHSSNEIKWINIDFFLEISCSGSNVSLHWYHKGSIVYPALTADPALTPYYPTADRRHSGNIWLVLKAAKIYFDLKKKKKNTEFFVSMNTMCFILVISF